MFTINLYDARKKDRKKEEILKTSQWRSHLETVVTVRKIEEVTENKREIKKVSQG